jgi:2-dehydro-3-deoxyphosphogluconate aldolase/(4S)-4-hydroxy-2-oxoglutarate aldolase
MENLLNQIAAFGVIPVIAIENASDAADLGEALIRGGLPCAEITFRTPAAAESIRLLVATFPDLLVGAGTVLTVGQAQQAVENGAKFLVTPGFDQAVVAWCIAQGVPIFPGVATPTEINMALQHGLSTLKFFPAEALGGVNTLKAISAPYSQVRFIPTGGVNPDNLGDYLKLPAVVACGGSWLVKKTLITNGEFGIITERVRETVSLVQEIRRR